jgi:RNA polymerase II-associated factor 1
MGGDQHIYMDRDAQIEAIEKTFTDAQRPIKEHYVKKGVYPTEIIPILPDTEMWKYPCAQVGCTIFTFTLISLCHCAILQVIFDTDPAPVGYSPTSQIEMMSQAMIRGVMDESGEQFVAYFLPTADTMEKRSKDFEEGRDYDDEQASSYSVMQILDRKLIPGFAFKGIRV